MQLSHQIGIFNISPEEYETRSRKVIETLKLPPEQITPNLVRFYIYDQLYIEHKQSQSTAGKIRNFFKKFQK